MSDDDASGQVRYPKDSIEDSGVEIQSSQQESRQSRHSIENVDEGSKDNHEQRTDPVYMGTGANDPCSAQREMLNRAYANSGVHIGFASNEQGDQHVETDMPDEGFDGQGFDDHHSQQQAQQTIGPRSVGLLGQPLQPRRRGHRRVVPSNPVPPLVPIPAVTNVVKKVKKKPGPKPSSKPPITLKDKAAKEALIREIEGHWGKDFIKNYIPKVHRPLTKRRKGKARTHNRRHDDNPKNWLPSVLKCILSLAKKTDDKVMLKKLMGDVVRMRNQHTGNKKPQLVTTDFDVMEDVLDHKWTIPMAFNIRYKHLLANRLEPTDTSEKNEYYKDLFVDSASEYDSAEEEDDEHDYEPQNDISDHSQTASSYHDAPPSGYSQPPNPYSYPWPPSMHGNGGPTKRRQPHPPEHAPQYSMPGYRDNYGTMSMVPQPNAYAGRGQAQPGRGQVLMMPVDSYDRPDQPYRTSTSFDLPNIQPRYPQPDGSHRRIRGGQSFGNIAESEGRPHNPNGPNGTVIQPVAPATGGTNRNERRQSIESTPETPLAQQRPCSNSNMQPRPLPTARSSPMPYIKSERQDDDGFDYTGSRGCRQASTTPRDRDCMTDGDAREESGGSGVCDDAEELEAQLALAEASAKAAQLRLQVLTAKNKKRSRLDRAVSGTPANPMTLD